MTFPTFTYAELLEASGGTPAGLARHSQNQPLPERHFRVWTDTRTLASGDFFLPLSGERFDGHDYLQDALTTGASGAFVQRGKLAKHPDWHELPNLIEVESPLEAYLSIASWHRQKINPLVIAVTGSSGKTTTKEMLYAAFSPLRRTIKTQKNFNNEVGVSQTLLSLQPDTEILIVEMGMRGPRQISPLSLAATPDAAIIVNVGPAHIEFLGSINAIADAKLEIAEGLKPDRGVLVLNGDNTILKELGPRRWPGKLSFYDLSMAKNLETLKDGEGLRFKYQSKTGETCTVQLPVTGLHMVANALGILTLGEDLGFSVADLAKGLSGFVPAEGRGESHLLRGYDNVRVVNDAYNANPDSVRAALQAFLSVDRPGIQSILILGGMKELGSFSEEYHQALGQWLGLEKGLSCLITVGEEARWIADSARASASYPVHAVADLDAVVPLLRNNSITPSGSDSKPAQATVNALQNTVLYLKGSRAYGLDTLPQRLEALALDPTSSPTHETLSV